ncbi:hypothetical protein B0J13DRAFT_665581, partial [Dactylonectria estremocensis]
DQVFLVIDALDECLDQTCRNLLSTLAVVQKETGMKILATSRYNTVEFTQSFEQAVVLEIRAKESDVKTALNGQREKLSGCVRNDLQLWIEVKERIATAIDGMFVLAEPLLDSLRGSYSPRDVEDKLDAFEKSTDKLSTVYKAAVDRIDRRLETRDMARRVLSWIIHARRVLTCQELQHALSVRAASLPFQRQLDKRDLIINLSEVVALCAGLVLISPESNTVQLMHHTARMFFEDSSQQPDWVFLAQTDITNVCVTYLSFDVFKNGPCLTDDEFSERLRLNPLYGYAALYWGEH